jgi:hypothetical protein
MENVSQIDWARLAAYIDGEGCVSITPRRKGERRHFYLRVQVANSDFRLLLWCRNNFGGSIQTPTRYEGQLGRKPVGYWTATCAKAEEILCECLPYFLIKGEQAQIALAYRMTYWKQTHGHKKLTDEGVVSQRIFLVKALKEVRKNPPTSSLVAAVGE